VFSIPDGRGELGRRIERRHIKHFKPTAATILLLLQHQELLLNRQVATEALDLLLQKHTLFLSCGPYVLKTFLSQIEEQDHCGAYWLKRMKNIELDWVTFPNLVHYPPDRRDGKDEWWWENDGIEVDVDYVTGFRNSEHYNEYDHEGASYDDNFYDANNTNLYPTFPARNALTRRSTPDPADPFGFSTHYPYTDPSLADGDDDTGAGRILDESEVEKSKLELLVALEVTPLFEYLSSPTFSLESITIPLYFISDPVAHRRVRARLAFPLPVRTRYWAYVAAHALRMLVQGHLRYVRIMYRPKDIWASMDPSDDLQSIVERGVWFREEDGYPEHAGIPFRAVWQFLRDVGVEGQYGDVLDAKVRLVKWEGDFEMESARVGDELEVVFTRAGVWREH
jgi:hypothetical protein